MPSPTPQPVILAPTDFRHFPTATRAPPPPAAPSSRANLRTTVVTNDEAPIGPRPRRGSNRVFTLKDDDGTAFDLKGNRPRPQEQQDTADSNGQDRKPPDDQGPNSVSALLSNGQRQKKIGGFLSALLSDDGDVQFGVKAAKTKGKR